MNPFDKYVGQVFDSRYKITKILGVGGMAVVFEAFDTKLNRIVALKMLKDEISNDSQSVKRFINESKAVSMLSHPNIVSIYDVSVKDNLKYIVMERVDGITLKSYMSQKGCLSYREAISYTEQILRALEHAHSKGIIHRDIKPQNIMLLKNGRIKVTDFGIAKLPNAETVTMTDKAIGTVYYISPEQASGKIIDQRSDLYSLGVLMYEMVTGQLPFDADSPVSVALMQVNTQPKAPSEIKDNIPKGLEQIIMLAMEKQPDMRFQNAAQMLRHLLQLKTTPNYVFKTKKSDGKMLTEDSSKEKGSPKNSGKSAQPTNTKGGRSMFPVILGVTLAFVLVATGCVFKLFREFLQENETTNEYVSIEVPDLVGQELNDELKAELTAQGFKINEVRDNSDPSIPAKQIMAQEPEAGAKRKVKPGTPSCDITITISQGQATINLLDYTTKDHLAVAADLTTKGLKYTEIEIDNEDFAAGAVVRTEPKGGTQVMEGDTITLYVSKGSNNVEIEVPSVIGQTEAQAEQTLINAGFILGEVTYDRYSSATKGTVTAQDTEAVLGGAVNIIVSDPD